MEYLSFTIEDEIARVVLDSPDGKVNVLNRDFMKELEETALTLDKTDGLKGVVVSSGKKSGFIAGADIHEIQHLTDPAVGYNLAKQGQHCFDLWARLNVPVVATVHGHCMGGGTEFILACHGRVVSEDAAIALPEVKLGILPGWGGTQRLPRLLPLQSALDMILTGKTIRGKKASKIGLADRTVSLEGLEPAALTLLEELRNQPTRVHKRRQRHQGNKILRWLETLGPVRSLILRMAQRKVMGQTRGHYPAPLHILDVLQRSHGRTFDQGLDLEAQKLGHLITTSVCKNLIHTFFLSERGKKPPKEHPEVPGLSTGAVLGAGVMGSGIAQWMAEKGFQVVLKDIQQSAVDQGLQKVRDIFNSRLKRRHQLHQLDGYMEKVQGAVDYAAFGSVEIVIEAVAEKMAIKQAVLKELEPKLSDTAIFATNTSALSVTELQSVADRPGQVGGLHFFNPVHRMPLVEVIRGEQTSDTTVASIFQASRQMGKIPIEVKDRPGFLVNRLLGTYLLEASHLVREGVKWHSLDELALEFGWPMGPFRLIDEIGLDIIAEVGNTLSDQLPYLKSTDLLDEANRVGLNGKKGGSGFYLYGDKEPLPNEELEEILGLPEERAATEEDFHRMMYLMVNEAGRCLDEGVVTTPEDIDTGTIFGLGFPPFRGGLARWADTEGMGGIRDRLLEIESLGERFYPSQTVRENGGFYSKD